MFLYYQLIYSPKHDFEFFLSVFPWIFGGYFVWQVFEWHEYNGNSNYSGFKPKLYYSIPSFAISLGVWLYYYFLHPIKAVNVAMEELPVRYENVTIVEWILL